VKSITFGSRKASIREDGQSYGSNDNLRLFCGVSFPRSMAPYEIMPHMSKYHESWAIDNGNHVMVPNPNEMISIAAPMTRASARVLEP
jgi:hypothetical protein